MHNPFFKNKGPFKIDELLKLSGLKNIDNFKNTKIHDIKAVSYTHLTLPTICSV